MLRHRDYDSLIAFLDDHPTSCRFGSTSEEFAGHLGEMVRITDGLEIV